MVEVGMSECASLGMCLGGCALLILLWCVWMLITLFIDYDRSLLIMTAELERAPNETCFVGVGVNADVSPQHAEIFKKRMA